MATRAKIKLPDKTELAIYSEGYPSYILKKIAEDVPLHTLHRAEPYRDSEGRALQINHFDYAYHIKPDVILCTFARDLSPGNSIDCIQYHLPERNVYNAY